MLCIRTLYDIVEGTTTEVWYETNLSQQSTQNSSPQTTPYKINVIIINCMDVRMTQLLDPDHRHELAV